MPYIESHATTAKWEKCQKLRSRIAALEARSANGTATPGDMSFLAAFHRDLKSAVVELVNAKVASGEWKAEEIIKRMSV